MRCWRPLAEKNANKPNGQPVYLALATLIYLIATKCYRRSVDGSCSSVNRAGLARR